MIDLETYFGAMSHLAEPDAETRANAEDLLARVGSLLEDPRLAHIDAATAPRQNSGWRTPEYNAGVKGAAKKSEHITGRAIDLDDDYGELDEFLFANRDLLIQYGFWMEHPASTKGWCHLQTIPPRSGNRVFFP